LALSGYLYPKSSGKTGFETGKWNSQKTFVTKVCRSDGLTSQNVTTISKKNAIAYYDMKTSPFCLHRNTYYFIIFRRSLSNKTFFTKKLEILFLGLEICQKDIMTKIGSSH